MKARNQGLQVPVDIWFVLLRALMCAGARGEMSAPKVGGHGHPGNPGSPASEGGGDACCPSGEQKLEVLSADHPRLHLE